MTLAETRVSNDVPRATWSRGELVSFLNNLLVYEMGARPPQKEYVLTSKPAPMSEASWASSARRLADVKRALQVLPFVDMMILFDVECRPGRTRDRRCARASEMWGVEYKVITASVQRSIERMLSWLNDGVIA